MRTYKNDLIKLKAITSKLKSRIHSNKNIKTPKQALDLFLQKYPQEKKFIANNFIFLTDKLYIKLKQEGRYRV
jgi:hypothetical protein